MTLDLKNTTSLTPQILLPTGEMASVKFPILTSYDGDVECDPRSVIAHPRHRQLYAMIGNSIVDAGLWQKSGPGHFNGVHLHYYDRLKGEAFDHDEQFLDRERIERDKNGHEITFCSYFGKEPRRTMLHIRDFAEKPTTTLLQDEYLLARQCRYVIAVKTALACFGYPEFAKRGVPEGFIRLLEEDAISRRRKRQRD